MSKKTFCFNAINTHFVAECNMAEAEHSANCPIVNVYRAGIDMKITIPEENPAHIMVQLPESTPQTANMMLSIGQSVCKCCRFNAEKGKSR